jgi:hypothetical protein
MQRKQVSLRIAGSLLGMLFLAGLPISKASAQSSKKDNIKQVEIAVPSQPFQATLNTFGGQAGPTFSVGPDQGTLSVTSLILTNLNNVVERVQIFQPSNADACGLDARIGGAGTIHMDLLIQPSQTLSLPFPTPLVFDSNATHSCIGMSGGSVPGIVVVQVTGFVS